MPAMASNQLRDYTIVMPLNVSRGYPSDYITQTAEVLKFQNQVVLFNFRHSIPFSHWIRQPWLWLQRLQALQKKKTGIIQFTPLGLLPCQRYSAIYQLNLKLGIFQLRGLLILTRKRVGLWGFHPLMRLLLGKLSESFSVYDCVDYYGEEIMMGETLTRFEGDIFRQATHVVFNSRALLRKKLQTNQILKKKAQVVACGCNVGLFLPKRQSQKYLSQIPSPRLGFVGHINYRLDFNLLFKLLRRHPNWSFVFIGPLQVAQPEDYKYHVKEKFQRLKSFPNAYFLGKTPKTTLPAILQAIDIGLIPYQTRFGAVRYCNPMKAYEYLACGKPTVSTNLPALKELHTETVAVTQNANEFGRAIENFLRGWDSSKAKLAVGIAQSHSWEVKVNAIERIIVQKLNKGDYAKS